MRVFVVSVRVPGNNHEHSPCPRLFSIVAAISVPETRDDRRSRASSTIAPCNSPRTRQYTKRVCSSRLTLLPPTTNERNASRETFRSDGRNNGAAATTPTNDKSRAQCVLITWLKNEMIYRSPAPRPLRPGVTTGCTIRALTGHTPCSTNRFRAYKIIT